LGRALPEWPGSPQPQAQVISTCASLVVNRVDSIDQESEMTDPAIARIRDNPKYQTLKSKRSSFGWLLTVVMLVVYYGFVSLIAFNKAFLGQRLGEGVTTIGIPLGLGVIIFTVLITGFYVRRANTEFDALTADILKEASK
jgi:uncharacterized membrane protein (DUF485 family)